MHKSLHSVKPVSGVSSDFILAVVTRVSVRAFIELVCKETCDLSLLVLILSLNSFS